MFWVISIFINVIIHEATSKDKSLKRIEGFGFVYYLELEAVLETIQPFVLNNTVTKSAVRI